MSRLYIYNSTENLQLIKLLMLYLYIIILILMDIWGPVCSHFTIKISKINVTYTLWRHEMGTCEVCITFKGWTKGKTDGDNLNYIN